MTLGEQRKRLEVELDKAHYPASKAQVIRNRRLAYKLTKNIK